MIRNLFLFSAGILLQAISSCGNDNPATTDTAKDTTKIVSVDSIGILTRQIGEHPDDGNLYAKRARFYMRDKKYDQALADADRALQIDSSNANTLMAAADINFFMGRVTRTDSLLTRAVRLHPENVECLLRLAQLDHYLTRYGEEIKYINQALHVDVHNAQAYFMKGMVYKEMHDTDKAISSMQTAVEQDPDYYNAYVQLGLIMASKKDPLAETYYQNALKINPNSEEVLYDLGMYYQEIDNYNAAIETYTALLKVNPHHFDAHFNMGMLHAVKLGVVDQGMIYFNDAIEDNPKEPRGYYGLGWCYEKKGDIGNAELNYKKALEVDSNYSNAAEALQRLNKIKK